MRRVMLYMWVAVGAASVYLVWVGTTRYLDNRRWEETAKAREQRRYPRIEENAGTAVRILQFYSNTGELVRGEHAVVCYGVQNARAVRLDPPVEQLKPALNRCFAVTPAHTTTYTLLADGFDGLQASASFTLEVRPPPPTILFVALSDREVRRGHPLTICYGVANATSARLEPIGRGLSPVAKSCLRLFPVRTTDFTLVAAGQNGRTDREKFTITVK